MPLVFRPARADELQRAEELVVRSINDLTERHGFGPMATLRPPDFQLFSLKDDPDGLWVAEADGEISIPETAPSANVTPAQPRDAGALALAERCDALVVSEHERASCAQMIVVKMRSAKHSRRASRSVNPGR